VRARAGATIVLLALAVPGAGGGAGPPRELAFAGAPLAFEAGGPRNDQVADLYAIREDGSGLRRLTRSIEAEDTPSWSPAGARLAFARGLPACHADACRGVLESDIWTVAASGGAARRLTRGRESGLIDTSPTWAPDGSRIAFTRRACCDSSAEDGVYVVGGRGEGLRLVTPIRALAVDWAPGGRLLAVAADGTAPLLVDPGTGEARPLRAAGLPTRARVVDLAWSPDGGRIALATTLGLYVVRSGRAGRVGARRAIAGVDWSRDGRTLGFAAAPAGAPRTAHGATTDLYVVGPNGTGQRRLTTRAGFDLAPAWR
jgi:Tol biopolymer transport system component